MVEMSEKSGFEDQQYSAGEIYVPTIALALLCLSEIKVTNIQMSFSGIGRTTLRMNQASWMGGSALVTWAWWTAAGG